MLKLKPYVFTTSKHNDHSVAPILPINVFYAHIKYVISWKWSFSEEVFDHRTARTCGTLEEKGERKKRRYACVVKKN